MLTIVITTLINNVSRDASTSLWMYTKQFLLEKKKAKVSTPIVNKPVGPSKFFEIDEPLIQTGFKRNGTGYTAIYVANTSRGNFLN